MKVKINNKEVFVLLFSEDQQQFHTSYLGWICADEGYGKKAGFLVVDESFAGGLDEKMIRNFPDYYRSLNADCTTNTVRSLLRRYKLENS